LGEKGEGTAVFAELDRARGAVLRFEPKGPFLQKRRQPAPTDAPAGERIRISNSLQKILAVCLRGKEAIRAGRKAPVTPENWSTDQGQRRG